MRVGGLATGMNIDQIVSDLMKAERMPLNKMEQEKSTLGWKRNAYREVNKQLFDLKNMAFDLKLESNMKSKTVTSMDSSSVTANASASAGEGGYKINVNQLATAASNYSESPVSADSTNKIDPDATLGSQEGKFQNAIEYGTFTVKTYNENGSVSRDFNVTSDKSLNDVLNEVNNSDLGVRAFYDANADQVMLEREKTGDFNTSGAEIEFDQTSAKFLASTLQVGDTSSGTWQLSEDGGQDAQFEYNNSLTISSHSNEYTLNGVTFNFHKKTSSNVTVNVSNNVDATVSKIVKFVDKYNKVIEDLNNQVSEKRYRDYKPLTDKQKDSMEEKEIELWQEKAKSGLLRSDSIIDGALYDMRRDWYSEIDNDGQYSHLSEIGITTSPNYRDNGKLIVNESELRKALTDDPDSAHKLFASDNTGGNDKGIARKLEETLENTIDSIERKAGKSSSISNTFSLGRQINELNDEMNSFQDRLVQVENRYWSQFTAMEKAIQKMNSQSNYMMQQFGGGM